MPTLAGGAPTRHRASHLDKRLGRQGAAGALTSFWLPNDGSSTNLEYGYAIDLDPARNRLRPAKLEPRYWSWLDSGKRSWTLSTLR